MLWKALCFAQSLHRLGLRLTFVSPFIHVLQAVTELHKLFKWVHRSRRGVLLFIDEALLSVPPSQSNRRIPRLTPTEACAIFTQDGDENRNSLSGSLF